jgi:hypothetical protein
VRKNVRKRILGKTKARILSTMLLSNVLPTFQLSIPLKGESHRLTMTGYRFRLAQYGFRVRKNVRKRILGKTKARISSTMLLSNVLPLFSFPFPLGEKPTD